MRFFCRVGWAHRYASVRRDRSPPGNVENDGILTKGGMDQYVANGNNAIDVTKAETMLAYWLAYNNLPMSTADEFSRMIPAVFPDSKIAKTSVRHERGLGFQDPPHMARSRDFP